MSSEVDREEIRCYEWLRKTLQQLFNLQCMYITTIVALMWAAVYNIVLFVLLFLEIG